MDVSIKFAPIIISTCCALHNLCEKRNIAISGPSDTFPQSNLSQPTAVPAYDSDPHGYGSAVRHALLTHINNTQPLRQSSRFL